MQSSSEQRRGATQANSRTLITSIRWNSASWVSERVDGSESALENSVVSSEEIVRLKELPSKQQGKPVAVVRPHLVVRDGLLCEPLGSHLLTLRHLPRESVPSKHMHFKESCVSLKFKVEAPRQAQRGRNARLLLQLPLRVPVSQSVRLRLLLPLLPYQRSFENRLANLNLAPKPIVFSCVDQTMDSE